jgi:hypothetical protein
MTNKNHAEIIPKAGYRTGPKGRYLSVCKISMNVEFDYTKAKLKR